MTLIADVHGLRERPARSASLAWGAGVDALKPVRSFGLGQTPPPRRRSGLCFADVDRPILMADNGHPRGAGGKQLAGGASRERDDEGKGEIQLQQVVEYVGLFIDAWSALLQAGNRHGPALAEPPSLI